MRPNSETPLHLRDFDTATDSPSEDWRAVHEMVGHGGSDDPLRAGTSAVIAYRGDLPAARAAYGVRDDFAGTSGRTGFVGWYEAVDDEAGVAVLREVVERVTALGPDRVVGPLNGSTWHRYRLVQPDPAGPLPFLSEPRNPAEYIGHFAAAGFRPLLEYESRLVAAPAGDPDVEEILLPRLLQHGISIRDLQVDRLDEELQALHTLSLEAFALNPFYSPIGYEEFAGMYRPLRPMLDPALVRLAVDGEGRLMGYVFAFSDPMAPAEHSRIVLKTLAAARAARGLGLGRALVDDINRTAAERGQAVIHALMQSGNVSRSISRRSDSTLFRRYTLFGATRA